MARSTILGSALLLVAPLVVIGAAPAQAAATATSSFVTMVSDQGDYIGGGGERTWYPGHGTITVSGSASTEVDVEVSGGPLGDDMSFTFAAPSGQTMTTGTYRGAERTPFRSGGHPGIDIYGDGRGCNEDAGQFTVLDIAPDLSRLWLTYVQHCEGGVPALFGEVRINEPTNSPGLLVAPDHISWPDTYPGVSGRLVPVTLVNRTTHGMTVHGATISAGQADFSIAGNLCTAIAAKHSCAIYVRFKPSASGLRTGRLRISDSSVAGTHVVRLAGHGIAGHTSWAMASDPGDYIGQGQSYSYTPANSIISASGSDSGVHFSLKGPGGSWWYADFVADQGDLLLPGTTFANATRYPFQSPTEPGMSIDGNGRGCNELTGTFTVVDAAYVDGIMKKISLTFVQHCEGAVPALRGSIAWHADNPAAPVPAG